MHKKTVIPIFLLCLVAMPLFFSVYTIIEKKMIEHRMKEKMERESLLTITIDASSVIWLKKNKEILINGKAFDIKSVKIDGSRIIFTGLYDELEKALESKLKQYQHSKSGSSSNRHSLMLLFMASYYHPVNPVDLVCPFTMLATQNWQKKQDEICSRYQEVIIPPPRLG